MKELNRKTFITIFSILSLFVVIGLTIVNATNYTREYNNLKRTLNIKENFKMGRDFPGPMNFENMMIMDYEVYSINIGDYGIYEISSHSNVDSSFDIDSIASTIVKCDKKMSVGNLYFSKYAYNYVNDNLIIVVNTSSIVNNMRSLLLETLIIGIILEIIIYIFTKLITKWITKPATDAFKRQKDFIADASHELKTPLAVIMASADELKENNYVNNIKYEAERMKTLIASMLDLSKLESGVTKSTYKEENLSKIIERVSLTFEAVAFEKKCKIVTNIEDNVKFNCSKDEIERLISIIVDNAIKHSNDKAKININMFKDKHSIKIEVINSGDPITPGDEEKIFDRFYRGDKARSRKDNRYGLGLAIAKNIVINHNGVISASSSNGKTTFTILFK